MYGKKRVLTLELHEKTRLARILDRGCLLVQGNYSDFYPGCQGGEITFADGMTFDFARRLKATVKKVNRVRLWRC